MRALEELLYSYSFELKGHKLNLVPSSYLQLNNVVLVIKVVPLFIPLDLG